MSTDLDGGRAAPLALVADPAPDSLGQLAAGLDREGYRTICAANLEDALAQAPRHRPDLIVTELWFAEAGGLEVVERWRRAVDRARLVVVTSVASIETAVAAVRLGATNVLTRPVTAREVVTAALDTPNAERAAAPFATPTIEEATEAYLRATLAGAGSVREAARRLGVDRRSLRRILDRYPWAAKGAP